MSSFGNKQTELQLSANRERELPKGARASPFLG